MNRLCRASACLLLCLGVAACAGTGGGDLLPSDLGDNDVPWLVQDVPPEAGDAPLGTATLSVQVLERLGVPRPHATVTVLGLQATSDLDGIARLEGLPAGRVLARVQAAGFAPTTASADLRDGGESRAQVVLLPLGPRFPFKVAEGALLFRNGVRVSLPPDAVVDADGNPVDGEVEATVAPLDPTTGQLLSAPGAFEGIRAGGGAPVLLDSVLMADITLWRDDQPVRLAPGAKATVTFALPWNVQQRSKVGDRIPLWWFDLDAGIWREEGEGVVQAGEGEDAPLVWVADVGHFSWFNCDDPLEIRNCVVVHVIGKGGVPVEGAQVWVYPPAERGKPGTWAGYDLATSDSNGDACADFPIGAAVEATLLGPGGALQGSYDSVTGGGPWSSCLSDRTKCLRLDLGACETDFECGDGDPCTEDYCSDDGCRHRSPAWVGSRCKVPGRNLEGAWNCDPRRCWADVVCGEDDLKVCLPGGLILDQPEDGDPLAPGQEIHVAGRAGCIGADLEIRALGPGGEPSLFLGALADVDGEFATDVGLDATVLAQVPGQWTLRVTESGEGDCRHTVERMLAASGTFLVVSQQKAGGGGDWFRIVYAWVPTDCPGSLRVAGADAPGKPRDLLGTAGLPAWNDIALTNGTPFAAGTGPTAYARGAGYESPAGNGPTPRACLAIDAASGRARVVTSTGRDPGTGDALFPGDSAVVCGGPMLLEAGEDVIDRQLAAEGFDRAAVRADSPWPRTAACVTSTQSVVILSARAASGEVGLDIGFTLPELAAYLARLGCVDALLLDQGAPVFFDADYPQYQVQDIPSLYNTLVGMDCGTAGACTCGTAP